MKFSMRRFVPMLIATSLIIGAAWLWHSRDHAKSESPAQTVLTDAQAQKALQEAAQRENFKNSDETADLLSQHQAEWEEIQRWHQRSAVDQNKR